MLDKELLGDLRKLIKLIESHEISEIEVESQGTRLAVRRRLMAAPVAGVVPAAAAAEEAKKPTPAAEGRQTVTSPLVGTFYAAASLEADPYVKEGDRVEAGQTLCIVEAMKLMNEIQAPVSGRISRILVKNGDPVEYGQELFEIVPA